MSTDVVPVLIPHETVNDEVVVVGSWQVAAGEHVHKDQLVAEVETSKVLLEIHAPCDGFLRYSAAKGAELPVGSPICYITIAQDTPLPEPVARPAKVMAAAAAAGGGTRLVARSLAPAPPVPRARERVDGPVRFSALASRLMEERGLAPETFQGSTLVRSKDVLAYLETREVRSNGEGAEPRQDHGGVPTRWEDLPRRKCLEAQYLRAGHSGALPSSVTVACPTRGLRAAIRASRIPATSPTPVIVFELARLLRKYPVFNAVCRGSQVGYYDEVNIGLAIDGGEGLVVPVIRNADRKELHEIASEIQSRVTEYLDHSLAPAAMTAGTFTVSDLSTEAVVSFAPLINREQAGILGVGCEFYAPGSSEGMINLTLVFDHQLSEGRQAARLLQDLVTRLRAYEAAISGDNLNGGASGDSQERCAICLRDAAVLQPMEGYLLRSAVPRGYICSICLAGYR